ncbi:MAG: S-adenosyl-l-methionine hydroxide adenosyltransferase family protein [Thermanaerothrix sp.]|nr:S-adenosyl-l-methionine hydroxide adenosyltransferase family protein [Thermanaerothrix sp.]
MLRSLFKKGRLFLFSMLLVAVFACVGEAGSALVFQTDFGLKDGAVSAMKGVAFGEDPKLPMYDLTHEIPPYSIWEASYRLFQTVQYWPEGTVFVSVVDPGVGTDRKPVVARTKDGRYVVTPDNGTLTLLADSVGLAEVRVIDQAKHMRKGSERSYTFHGRDLFAYTGAKLASGKITFEEVGPVLKKDVVRIPYQRAEVRDGAAYGTIPVLDVQYGNVWTNIGEGVFGLLKPSKGKLYDVRILKDGKEVYRGRVPFVNTFGDVPEGEPLLYYNSLMNLSLALNMDSFAEKFKVSSGPEWSVEVRPAK